MGTQTDMLNFLWYIKQFFLLVILSSLSIFNVHAEELKVETVIIEGYGTDIPSAAQNAAQNALSQVVGSFIDSNKIFNKQVEISEGVRSQVKSITTNIKEYSQGSIKSFEVIKVGEQSGLITVLAKVDVRIDDFKKYIEDIVSGEKDIDNTSLFAQAATKTKQYENKTQILIENVLEPLIKGGVIKFEISAPSAFYPRGELVNVSEIKQMSDSYGSENLYVFNVTATIDNDFIENFNKSVEAIASNNKKARTEIKLTDTHFGKINSILKESNAGSDDFYIIIHEGNSSNLVMNWEKTNTAPWHLNIKTFPSSLYVIRDVLPRLKDSGELGLSFTKYPGPPIKNLIIQLIDESGNVLQEILANTKPYEAFALPDDYTSRVGFKYAWQMYIASDSIYSSSLPRYYGIGVVKKRAFKLVVAINQEALLKAKKIVLKMSE